MSFLICDNTRLTAGQTQSPIKWILCSPGACYMNIPHTVRQDTSRGAQGRRLFQSLTGERNGHRHPSCSLLHLTLSLTFLASSPQRPQPSLLNASAAPFCLGTLPSGSARILPISQRVYVSVPLGSAHAHPSGSMPILLVNLYTSFKT